MSAWVLGSTVAGLCAASFMLGVICTLLSPLESRRRDMISALQETCERLSP